MEMMKTTEGAKMRVQYVYADNRVFLISILASYKQPEFNLVYLVTKL